MTNYRLLCATALAALSVSACDMQSAEGPAADSSPADTMTAETGAPASIVVDLAVTPETPDAVSARCGEGLEEARAMKTALETSEATPGIDTTLRAFDDLYLTTIDTFLEGYLLSETHPDPAIRQAGALCLQESYNLYTSLGLSRPIYDRLSAIDLAGAPDEVRYLVEKQLIHFRQGGVTQDEEGRAAVEALQSEITATGLQFSENIREDDTVVTVEPDRLKGLPEDYIANHPVGEDGLVTITMAYPDVFPILQYAGDVALRREVMTAFDNRAYPENQAVFRTLLEKRYELAQLLNYPTYAHLNLDGKMIGTPERAEDFIDDLAAIARPAAERYHDRLLERMKEDVPEAEQVPSWSSAYYKEIVRQADYDLNAQEVRRYFAFDNVNEGMLTLVEDLFNVEIVPWDTPVWHESVQAYEMLEEDGTLIGRFFMDLHPREGKYSHAAMFPLRVGMKGETVPMASLVTNFPAGSYETGLMEHGQVETFLHEFGHLIHWLFSGNLDYALQNFSEIESDFTEAPSMMLEEWVWDYDNLKQFAVNEEGEVLPEALFDKMIAARNFGQGAGVMSQLAYSDISLSYYDRPPSQIDIDALYDDTFARYSVFEQPDDTHDWASFGHLDGYGAAYYTYQWSQAIALDIFSQFEENGLRDPATAQRYRDLVLAPGGRVSANVLLQNFLGRPFSVEAYEKRLKEEE